MKWVTFICVLFLLSSASSSSVVGPEAHKHEIAKRYKNLGEEHFRNLVLVFFSQFLRKNPFDEILKLTNKITELARVCTLDRIGSVFCKLLDMPFTAKLCAASYLPENYGDMAICCETAAPERFDCFLKHKDEALFIPPLKAIVSDAICTAFEENDQKLLERYIYEVARRNSYFNGPELLYYTQEYKGVLTECCEAADKAACLGPKMDALQEKVLASAFIEKFKCSILQNIGESALREWFIARLGQNFPNADFMTVSGLATNLTKIHKECCESDLLECADDKADLAKYMCENQVSISNNLAGCCNKPVLEKFHCLADVAGDNSVEYIAPLAIDFVDKEDFCINYIEAKDDFLDRFLHQYSRKHPEHSVSLLLRLAKKYEATLEDCCDTHDAHACYTKVLYELQPLLDEPQEFVKKKCELFENLGEYGLQNAFLVRYTKKLPQLSTQTLVHLSRNLACMGSKCCKLPESLRTACAEDYLFVVLNWFCVEHEKTPVSNRLTVCCTESFLNRRPCLSALKDDETYVPKEFYNAIFTLHPYVCERPEPEQQFMKQIVLAEMLKHKPKATEEQLNTVVGNFSAFVQKCCAADKKNECFSEEAPKFIALSQAALA